MITIATSYTKKDFSVFFARPRKKTALDWVLFYFAFLMLVNFLAAIMTKDVFFSIFSGLMFCFFGFPQIRTAIIGNARYEALKKNFYDLKIQINDKEVKVINSMASTAYPWTSIKKVEETPEYLFLILLSGQGIIIPRRDVSTEKTWNEIIALAKKHVPTNEEVAQPKQKTLLIFFSILAIALTYVSLGTFFYVLVGIIGWVSGVR